MCGIGGAIAPEASQEFRYNLAHRQLCHTDIRGKDASGIGWHEDQVPKFIKGPIKGSDFVKTDEFRHLEGSMPDTWIMHCRKTTKGAEQNNKNNHPQVCDMTGVMLVHNGTISNDGTWRILEDGCNPYIYGDFQAEVDTEAILRLIVTMKYIPRQDDGSVIPDIVASTPKDLWTPDVTWSKAIDDAAANLEGGFTVAMLVPEEPNVVYLVRHNNPLYLAFVPKYNAMVWGSTPDIVKATLTDYEVDYLFDFIPIEKQSTLTYHGVEPDNDTVTRVEYTGGGEYEFEYFSIKPPYVASKGRSVVGAHS